MKSYEISVEARPERIIAARKRRKLSQAATARAAGITAAYLCLLEKGRQRTATNTVAMKIAAALGVEPEEVFAGYVEPVEDREGLLTAEEREEYARRYLDKLRESVWHRQKYFNFDFEEAYSEALVVFARALFTYKKTSNCGFPHYVDHALEGTFKSECRKRNTAKRKALVYSLDAPLCSDSKKTTDFYNVRPSTFDLEGYIIIREECREAIKALSPERRRDPYIAGLLEVVGI